VADITQTDAAWSSVLEAYPQILEVTERGGVYEIQASDIKRFREPRLMTKFDTSANLPFSLKRHRLDVLPNSRHSYLIGRFSLYESFPDITNLRPERITLPEFETLRVERLTSEVNAINALKASGALELFLGERRLFETFGGRMGTSDFEFDVDLDDGSLTEVSVHAAQLEIDGGFESESSIVIMEAKNVLHKDFHVRQLYYPYRKYFGSVRKPIRLVFSQYTNLTYYLHEYAFQDFYSYSSIKHLSSRIFTFEDAQISASDLWEAWEKTRIVTDDNRERVRIPFPQADRFEIVLSLLEHIASFDDGMNISEVAEFIGYVPRQANYYPGAGEYLGLFDRSDRGKVKLTQLAKDILTFEHRDRQLAYAQLMFRHEIFHRLFPIAYESGTLPSRSRILEVMRELNVCNVEVSTAPRRASTVLGWLRWLMLLPDEE